MSLESWLASLRSDVSTVSGVQALIHKGFSRYVTETADSSGVSETGATGAGDTAETAVDIQTYQAKALISLGCTGDTADTCKTINADIQTTDAAATPTQTGPKRLFRQRGPWWSDRAQSAAQAYHAHHFSCQTCIAAGRGIRYGRRCAVGLALWHAYTGADNLQTEGGQHGQA